MDEKIEQKSERVDCDDPDVGDKLHFHFNGHTSTDERMRIEKHLKRCKDCREEMRFLKAARQVHQADFSATALAFLKSRA